MAFQKTYDPNMNLFLLNASWNYTFTQSVLAFRFHFIQFTINQNSAIYFLLSYIYAELKAR